jgi:hypothetical protein
MKLGGYVCMRKNHIGFCHVFHVFHEMFESVVCFTNWKIGIESIINIIA